HKRYEQHLHRLLREITHRSKNLLAVVQGIARQTAETVKTPQDFIARFGARLQALSGAHDLLVRQSWQGVELRDLILREIETY
ncbi:HWE histidine kinase domain-containing protein, partial [Acinetobacter baumannii]